MTIGLAWRNIWRNRRRSFLTAATVACSIAFIMGALCFMNGFSTAIEEDLLVKSGHFRIVKRQYLKKQRILSLRSAINNAPALANELRELPGIRNVREQIVFGATVDTDGDHQYPLVITGFSSGQGGLAERLQQCLSEGSLQCLTTRVDNVASLILGKRAANKLGKVHIGQTLIVMANGKHGSLCARDFKLRAIVEMEAANLDQVGYAPLYDVRNLLHMSKDATDIIVYLNDSQSLQQNIEKARTMLGKELIAQPWYDVAGVGSFISSHYRIGGLVALLILFVSAVCVSNTMIMTVLERKKEMGLMAALGFSRWQVVSLFQAECTLLALIGVIPGTLFGLAVCYYTVTVGFFWGHFTAFPLRSMAYGRFELWIWIWAIAISVCTAIGASFFPILRHTKVEPSEALRCA